MLKFYERNESNAETLDDFQNRVNADVDSMRDANLVVNLAPFGGLGTLTIWAQVGQNEPVTAPNGQLMGMQFKDLSAADVAKKLDARRAALARGPSRVLRPTE